MIKNNPRLSEEYLDYLSNVVPCIHEDLWKKIVFYTYELVELPAKVKYVKDIKQNFIGYCKDYNRYNQIWWKARGWTSEIDIEYQIWKYKKEKQRTSISPFSLEFWINKGYTKEEADYKRNSIRPIRKEYWLERGFSESAAIEKAKQTKEENNRKASKNSKGQKPWSNNKNIRYYLELGFSFEEAKDLLKERQATFSLEKCIAKYGEKEGPEKWKKRQNKWQRTLNNKPKKEIEKTNRSKSSIVYKKLKKKFSDEEIKNYLKESRNIEIVLTVDEFVEKIENTINGSIFYIYNSIEYISKKFPQIQFDILGITNPIKFLEDLIGDKIKPEQKYLSFRGYQKTTPHGLLRSSYEIYFYEFLIENNIEFLLDKRYPNSSMRYDFFVKETNEYIELCPMYNKDEEYRDKMIYKEKEFGAILLKNKEEIDSYLETLKKYYEYNH